ncbi:MAG: hypothetical protein AB1689_02435, partial [Thermodesulfobacteriota bacterium]
LTQNLRRDYHVPPGETTGGFPAARAGMPDGPVGDVGSLEVKSAWKILTPAEIASGAYYTRTFALDDPDGPVESRCRQTTMGLVGMHIVYQPALFGNPEWVWATFEHRANVPTAGIDDGATAFSFHDPSCTPVKTPAECAAYDAGVSSPEEFRCCPNLMLYPDASELPASPVPSQITRATDPTVSTILPTNCTDRYVAAIERHFGADNVWRNYFLVSTQWPLRGASTNFPPYDPGTVANFPRTLGNTTLETFLVAHQAPAMNGCSANARNPLCRACNGDCVATEAEAQASCPGGRETPGSFTTADCMGCHGTYAPQNSSFLFAHRPCCVRRDGFVPNVCGASNDRADCESSQACTWVASDPACAS